MYLHVLVHVVLFADMGKRQQKKRKEKKSRFFMVLLTCLLHLVPKSSGQPICRQGPCKQKNLPNVVLQYRSTALLLVVLEDVWLLLGRTSGKRARSGLSIQWP
jgi:hypothetical protein